MKTHKLFAAAIAAMLMANVALADLVSDYGIGNTTTQGSNQGWGIADTNNWTDNINLVQLFNNYFGTTYSSSNQLFNDRGVDPNSSWTTSNSEIVGGFKAAALGHQMSVIDNATGANLGSFINMGGTDNLGTGGITDLSKYNIGNIANGLDVSFKLDAFWGSTPVYSWSSDPDNNGGSMSNPLVGSFQGDGMVHMLALNVTDLYNAKKGTTFDSVFMFAWEDLHLTAKGGGENADWDYQDFVVLMTNVKPGGDAVPEPATLALVGLGLAGVGLVARRRNRK